jgi:hypothetical protein
VFAGGPGRIIRSDDGGQTWTAQEINCTSCAGVLRVADIDMLSATEGWAATSFGLLRTTDGVHWFEQPTGQDHEPARVDFVSSQDGWIVTASWAAGEPTSLNDAVVARTNDAGATWTPLAGVPADVQGLCFSSADDGWLATRKGAYHSTDGGATWTVVIDQASAQPDQPTTTVQCTAPDAAWVEITAGGAAPNTIGWTLVHIADGGQRSIPVAASGASAGRSQPGPFAVFDPFHAFLVEYTPGQESLSGIFVTSIGESGQRTVITQNVVNGASFTPRAVSFADKSHGVLVGYADSRRPSIYTTADRGTTWTSATSTSASPVIGPTSTSQGS